MPGHAQQRRRRAHPARGGFTLLELVISTAVLAGMLLVTALVTTRGNQTFQQAESRGSLEQRANRTLDRIVEALSMSGGAGLTPNPVPPFGASSIDIQVPTGIVGPVVQWGEKQRIEFQYTAADPNDGVDNDGDGFIDDGRVVLIRHVGQPTAQTTVLCSGVSEYAAGETPNGIDDNGNGLIDEKGLSFVANGSKITVSLTLVGRDARGGLASATVSTEVRLRN